MTTTTRARAALAGSPTTTPEPEPAPIVGVRLPDGRWIRRPMRGGAVTYRGECRPVKPSIFWNGWIFV